MAREDHEPEAVRRFNMNANRFGIAAQVCRKKGHRKVPLSRYGT